MATDANGNTTPDRTPNSTANNATAPASPAIDISVVKSIADTLGLLKDKFIELYQPVVNTVAAFDAMSRSSNVFAGAMGDLAGKFSSSGASLVKSFGQLGQDTNQAIKQGLGGLDMTDFNLQLHRGNITVDEYLKLMREQGPYLQGLGRSAEESGKNLGKMTEAARDSTLGPALTKYGIAIGAEAAHIQAIGSMNATKVDVNNKTQRDALAQANAQLALGIQTQANLTGKSRDAIEAELEERLKQPEVAARMRLMNEDQRQSFIRNQLALTGLGESAQKAAANIGIGGRPTQEQSLFLKTLGPAAKDFQRASLLMAKGKTADDRAAGKALMDRAMANAAVYRQSDEYANQQAKAKGTPLGDAFNKAQSEDRQSARIKQLMDANPSLTPVQALNQARREAGVVKSTETEKPGQQLQGAANRAEVRTRRAGQSAAQALDDAAKGNNGVAPRGKEIAAGIDKLSNFFYAAPDAINTTNKALDAFIDDVKKITTATGGNGNTSATPRSSGASGNPPAPPTNTPSTASGNVPPPPAATPRPTTTPAATPAVTPAATPRPTTTPAATPAATPRPVVTGPPSGASGNVPLPPPRGTGTLGETGNPTELKDVVAQLHKGETVLTPGQLSNLISGTKQTSANEMLANMQGMLGNGAKNKTSAPNFNSMFEGINTKISSVNSPKTNYDPTSYVSSNLKPPTIEQPKTSAPTTESIANSPINITDHTSLKDVNEQLIRLNTGIMQLVAHSAQTVDLNTAQIRATKSLSGNKFA